MSIDASSLPNSFVGSERARYWYRTLMLLAVLPRLVQAPSSGGWPSEQRCRAARVVLLPDPDMHLAVPPQLVQAPS
ncbi:hypothetical protein AAC387_Pa03g2676 [Persea americana]